MPFEIVRNDIVNMEVDAIVNTANPDPVIGTGVESAIYKKAGKNLLADRKKTGKIAPGEVAITKGYGLYARYVIHAVGPIWKGGNYREKQCLASCYKKVMVLAKEYGCASLAFPLLSTGNYGFPKALALQIAVQEISNFLLENDMQIYLVVFGKEEFVLSEKLFKSVNSYIDENYIHDKMTDEYGEGRLNENVRILRTELLSRYSNTKKSLPSIDKSDYDGNLLNVALAEYSDDLTDLLDNLDAGFSETLLKLIDKTGKKDSEIYKKANVDRKLFSKIRNNVEYKPSKTTALAFAFALELNLNETKDFIGRAGYALSHSNKFDVIIEYFLVNQNYNIYELNEVLFAFDEPLLGS